MTGDAELLRAYVEKGSEDAFTELVRKYLGLVYSVALRQVGDDTHLAEDVVQKVFTDLARKARPLAQHPVLSGWLYRSTQFAAIDALRTEQRRRAREQEAQIMHELSSPLASAAEQQKLRTVLDQAMGQLNDRDRDAVMLRFFEDRPFAEIGERFCLTEEAARKRVERALDKLKTHLARRGLSSTAAALGAALSQEVAAAAVPAGLATTISGGALAAASTAPGLGLLFFMTAQKSAVLISVLGLISVGIGFYEWQKSQDVHAALVVATQRYDAGQQHLQALLSSAEAAEKALADLQKEGIPRATASAPVSTAAPLPTASRAEWEQFTAADPEVRSMLFRTWKVSMSRDYQLFFAQAKLTPAQVEEFLNRTIDFQIAGATLRPGARYPQSDNSQLPDDQLRGILGDQAFRQFRDYKRMESVLPILNLILRSSSKAGALLSADQFVQLAQIVTDHSPDYKKGERLNLNSVDWADAMAEAQTLLSSSQWKAAEGWFIGAQSNQEQAQARQRIESASAGAGKKS